MPKYKIHPVISKNTHTRESFELDADHKYMEDAVYTCESDVLAAIIKELRGGTFKKPLDIDSFYAFLIWVDDKKVMDIYVKEEFLKIYKYYGERFVDSMLISYQREEKESFFDKYGMDPEDFTGTLAEAINFIDRATVSDESNTTNGLGDRLFECIGVFNELINNYNN